MTTPRGTARSARILLLLLGAGVLIALLPFFSGLVGAAPARSRGCGCSASPVCSSVRCRSRTSSTSRRRTRATSRIAACSIRQRQLASLRETHYGGGITSTGQRASCRTCRTVRPRRLGSPDRPTCLPRTVSAAFFISACRRSASAAGPTSTTTSVSA